MSDADTPADPAALRAQIAETRAELGDTVEALAAKTDVKARAQHAASQAADTAKAKLSAARDQAADLAATVSDRASTAAATVRDTVRGADLSAQVRRPVPLAAIVVGAAAIGLAIYLLRRRRS